MRRRCERKIIEETGGGTHGEGSPTLQCGLANNEE